MHGAGDFIRPTASLTSLIFDKLTSIIAPRAPLPDASWAQPNVTRPQEAETRYSTYPTQNIT